MDQSIRWIELEPAVILAYDAILKTKRINIHDLYHLTEQINNYGVEAPVTIKDVEHMLIRFMSDSELFDRCLQMARECKN